VTYYAPETHHGGAMCVQRLLADYPRDRLVWMHHAEPVTDPASPWSKVRQWSIPLLRRPSRFGLAPLRDVADWTLHAPRVARLVAEQSRRAGVQAVLGIGPGISVRISHQIAQRLGIPLLLWIHDDPAAHATYRNLPRPLVQWIRRCFVNAYRSASMRYTISEPMRDHYHDMTGCDAVVLPPPIEVDSAVSSHAAHDGPIRIGFAGAITEPEAWLAFLGALERLSAKRRFELTVFADPQTVPVPSPYRRWVRLEGWRDADTVHNTLQSMDYLYLPLWFRADRRVHVATSFSTKFVGYLATGLPVLCHVPTTSAVAEFIGRHPVGPVLDTLDTDTLTDRLRGVFDDPTWHERAAELRDRALTEFDRDRAVNRLHMDLRTLAFTRTEGRFHADPMRTLTAAT
jgi:hypothetical protein